jgi:formamidopyrimidine-DNA glycosylase
VALLDQRAVAGVGNLYAAEILHLARVHPAKRCDQINGDQWQAIHRSMIDVLQIAIRYEGSTLSDGTYRNALNELGGYQNHHRVYDRAGQTCASCHSGTVVRIVQAQRATFYCPACQTKRARPNRAASR